jgi:hypothetical protein
MTKREHTTQDPAYRKARQQLLADHPPCHWCGKPNAETADHLVEVDRGGSHTDGLVPSCRSCNSKRGQRYKAQRDAQKQHARREAMKDIGIPISKEKTEKTQNEKKDPPNFCFGFFGWWETRVMCCCNGGNWLSGINAWPL